MKDKKALRSALFGSAPTFRSEIIKDSNGNEFEVRQPSIRGRADIRKAATTINEDGTIQFEPFDFMLHAAIACTFVPGTDDKVFCPEDYEMLVSLPSGGIIDELSKKAADFCNVEGKGVEVKKPSSEITKDS
jgi:hypothetical protein